MKRHEVWKTRACALPRPLHRQLRALVVFGVLAAMGHEAAHAATEHHNEHGNRRERIEEQRRRLEDARHYFKAKRTIRTFDREPPL